MIGADPESFAACPPGTEGFAAALLEATVSNHTPVPTLPALER